VLVLTDATKRHVEDRLNANHKTRPVTGLEVAEPHLDTIVRGALRRRGGVKPERARRIGSCIPCGNSPNKDLLSTARIEGVGKRALKGMILNV